MNTDSILSLIVLTNFAMVVKCGLLSGDSAMKMMFSSHGSGDPAAAGHPAGVPEKNDFQQNRWIVGGSPSLIIIILCLCSKTDRSISLSTR